MHYRSLGREQPEDVELLCSHCHAVAYDARAATSQPKRDEPQEGIIVGSDGDHWGKLAPLLLYGGGIRPGVIGQSTRDGGEPLTQPCNPQHLIASMLHRARSVLMLRPWSLAACRGVRPSPQELPPLLLGQYPSRDPTGVFLPHRRLGDDMLPAPLELLEHDGALIRFAPHLVP